MYVASDTVKPVNTYDATGNRTTKVIGATTYTNTISPTSDRVTQIQDVGGTFSVGYDAAGNITADGTNTFTYSDRGRMATAANARGHGELQLQRAGAAGEQEWPHGACSHGCGLLRL